MSTIPFHSSTHVLAVIAGAARDDGDATRYFGSLLGFADHAGAARKLGLVEFSDIDDEISLTAAGREFADRFRLREAPDVRANYWEHPSYGFGTDAEAELGRLWDAL